MNEHKITHGMSYTRTYKIWQGMKYRCTLVPGDRDYEKYAGRGIDYDPRWEAFESFLADMGEAPEGLTLERIDNSRGYSKANCKWATHQEQHNNKRSNVLITHQGRTLNVRQWARELGLPEAALYRRAKLSNRPEYIFAPVKKYNRK